MMTGIENEFEIDDACRTAPRRPGRRTEKIAKRSQSHPPVSMG
jgi:hypothetical protein